MQREEMIGIELWKEYIGQLRLHVQREEIDLEVESENQSTHSRNRPNSTWFLFTDIWLLFDTLLLCVCWGWEGRVGDVWWRGEAIQFDEERFMGISESLEGPLGQARV